MPLISHFNLIKPTEKSWQFIIAVISFVYILFRVWNLTDSCLWFDEIFSVHAAEHSWESLFGFVALDLIHPPFFYVLLKLWISVGGESLFWLRFFSACFSTAALIPFYLLCRRLQLNYPAMAIAFLLFAVNGCLIKYSQEVRMYSVLLCLSLFSMWLFVRFLDLGKSFWILTIINILLVHTHYFGWFVVGSQVLAILILQRIKSGQIFLMFGINLVCFVPWILIVLKAAETSSGLSQNIGWIAKPDHYAFLQFIFDLIEPFYFQASSIDLPSNYGISLPVFVVLFTAQICYISSWKKKDKTEKRNFILLTIFILLPILLAFAASWIFPYSVWGTRHLIIVFAPLAILAAKCLEEIEIIPFKVTLVSLLLPLFIIALILKIIKPEPKYIWCGWESLAQTLDRKQSGKIYVFEDLTAYHFWFAMRESDNFQVTVVKDVEGLEEDKSYFLPRGFDAVRTSEIDKITDEKFWIAFKAKDWNEAEPPLRNLRLKGYRIGEPKVFEAQKFKAFLVLVEK
ncbi:hypothetical protein BH10ACI1_BH10ACI1_04490 [soil metagenome]